MSRKTAVSHGGIHTPQMACYHAAHSFKPGLDALALMMGTDANKLRRKLNCHQADRPLTLEDAMHILRITDDTRILDSVCTEIGAVWFFPDDVTQHPSDMDVLKTSTGLMDRTMGVINEFHTALEDGDISAAERAKLDKCLMELQRQIHRFNETAKQFERPTQRKTFGHGGKTLELEPSL